MQPMKKIEIKLPEHLVKQLLELPETGMAYQIVDFWLQDGTILKNVTVLNSSIAILDKEIDTSKIVKVRLSKK